MGDAENISQIVGPAQYSPVWIILGLAIGMIASFIVFLVLWRTRMIAEAHVYHAAPNEYEALIAEFLRATNDIGVRHYRQELAADQAHYELIAMLRRFVTLTSGKNTNVKELEDIKQDARMKDICAVMESLYEPGFAIDSDVELANSLRRVREVIRQWSWQ
ncbi:hypothetical protein [Devriesea agamarum]|uniref:hypothetical protein n=1 Tax=Devriesea agamarum TaxID=472569 RepID=UPI00071E0E7C|nr:hypothetical protein [Devriesea agamarum]